MFYMRSGDTVTCVMLKVNKPYHKQCCSLHSAASRFIYICIVNYNTYASDGPQDMMNVNCRIQIKAKVAILDKSMHLSKCGLTCQSDEYGFVRMCE